MSLLWFGSEPEFGGLVGVVVTVALVGVRVLLWVRLGIVGVGGVIACVGCGFGCGGFCWCCV